jgi:hypothetical protein
LRFWSYVIAALDMLQPDSGAIALALLQSPQPPPIETVLTPLLNALSTLPTDGVLVLVDPGTLFDTPGVPPEINAEWQAADQTIMRLAPILARLGVMRLLAAAGLVSGHGDLPIPVGAAYDTANLTTTFWDTVGAQNQAMPATSAEVLGASHDYGALPLIVLSADQPTDRSRQIWTGLNAQLAARSSAGVHHVVAGAGHMALALDRDHAQATIAAIQQVVDAAQTAMLIQP